MRVPSRAQDPVGHAHVGIVRFINFYNAARTHTSLNKQTPDKFYFTTLPPIQQAV